MKNSDKIIKRAFDLFASVTGLLFLWPIILVCLLIARVDTGASGIFSQTRVGQSGKLFKVYKIRTMRNIEGSTVTAKNDARITKWGRKFRHWKLDELPQLWNVLKGEMSFVGPRPDVPGYLDKLAGEDRDILNLKPGITGPATLHFRNEEELLAKQKNPIEYNDTVIWPEKVRLNLEYYRAWSLRKDFQYIFRTLTK